MEEFDLARLDLEHRVRQLKSELRTTWRKPMWQEQQELLRHQDTLTLMYVLIAHNRGHEHVKSLNEQSMFRWFGWNPNLHPSSTEGLNEALYDLAKRRFAELLSDAPALKTGLA